MGKAARLKRLKREAARQLELDRLKHCEPEDAKLNHSYWVAGYLWNQDTIIIEPFCVVKTAQGFEITNLNKDEIDYHYACRLLEGDGRMMLYKDRIAAMEVCDAFIDEKAKLDAFSKRFSDEQMAKIFLTGG